jgi:hypothetical protein
MNRLNIENARVEETYFGTTMSWAGEKSRNEGYHNFWVVQTVVTRKCGSGIQKDDKG